MLLGALSFGKEYTGAEYLSVVIMVCGICTFGGTDVMGGGGSAHSSNRAASSGGGMGTSSHHDSSSSSSNSRTFLRAGGSLDDGAWLQLLGMICMFGAVMADGMVSHLWCCCVLCPLSVSTHR